TLEDLPKTPVVVYGTTPWSQASLTVAPAIVIEPGTCSTSSGVVRPSSIAAAAVMILLTEPGSNGELTARLPCSASGGLLATPIDGSKVLSLDIARTSPVCASSTTADAFFAPDSSFARCTSC